VERPLVEQPVFVGHIETTGAQSKREDSNASDFE
jgi:hypothetical protein